MTKPYTIVEDDTKATVYYLGSVYKTYDIIDEAYADCDRLNTEFYHKSEAFWAAFLGYMNAPRGWTWEARMGDAIKRFDRYKEMMQEKK